ncbi:hypothetical protein NDU88_002824 [Pleurodeles waltl]|uniref:Uncharacterized protein n=1 Tax=Pleurodeles waltl TaxID=8319 RepID=A0AAV7Q760_PLEWA|nr:hypothetical protein NDU88_002824 [Pleurodeles waltl]
MDAVTPPAYRLLEGSHSPASEVCQPSSSPQPCCRRESMLASSQRWLPVPQDSRWLQHVPVEDVEVPIHGRATVLAIKKGRSSDLVEENTKEPVTK